MANQEPPTRTRKKLCYPIGEPLRSYLKRFRRERRLPVTYDRLRAFQEAVPITDARGVPTLWDSVIHRAEEMPALHEGLKQIYALLKVDGDFSVVQHLYIDRVDFCSFGNSMPFRIRIVNAYNDNQDYFYIKQADASRVYGLELEHLLSPNRLNYLTDGGTLVEEHVAGIPGDVFIERWLQNPELRPIRIAKELVKFNERCFIRLLGDMRSYNFVFVVTPDFEGSQIRIRAMDFDQQSHHGRMHFYLPQYFKENGPLVDFCLRHLNRQTAYQYQREEQTLLIQRVDLASVRLGFLLEAMTNDRVAPPENVTQLGESLAEHYGNAAFASCASMGDLVRVSLETVRSRLEQSDGPKL